MERCTVRFGLVAVSVGACLVAVTGCETLGLRKADGPDKKQPAFYDEFLESDEVRRPPPSGRPRSSSGIACLAA